LIAPFIYVEDVPLIFPPEVSGSTSPPQSLKLTNLGASSASVAVRANGPASPIQVSSNCGSLAPGASCTVQIAYAPNSGSNPGGEILINSNSQVSNSFPFASAAGLNTSDPLQLSLPLLSFETVVVGQHSLPHPITLTNATNSALAVPSPVIGNTDFAISSHTCAKELQPAQTCAMAIVYSPSAVGPAVQSTLTLAGNSSQLILVGTPMAVPAVSPKPSSLTFGPVPADGKQSQTVKLSNTGSTAVPVNAIVTSTEVFTASDNCIGTLAAHQNCSIHVSFTPAGEIGTFSGTLWISVSDGAVTLPVALAGTSTKEAAATPVFSVKSGAYPAAQSVSITDATPGAAIYYTTNGTAPTTSSSRYTAAIEVSKTETLEAIAVAKGYSNSAVASAKYTITLTAATPTFSPPAGTYTSARSVTISDTTPGAAIYYTTSGTTPTTSSTKYKGTIKVSATETIKAIAVATGYSASALASATYTIATTPTVTTSAATSIDTPKATLNGTVTANNATTQYYGTSKTALTSATTKTGAVSDPDQKMYGRGTFEIPNDYGPAYLKFITE